MEILALQTNEARVRFPAGAAYFAGHFPGQPIVPGVVLIDAAVQVAARATGRPLRLLRLAHAKFVRAVGPDQEAVLSFAIAPDPERAERLKISGKWSQGETKVAEMLFTAADEGGSHGP
jgi:3-hydroxymyristoyl/3-hydroxydecanoyl-(acyl carrier protein) dehydratase